MFMAVRATGARVAGDIGCYTLGALDPLRGLDTSVAMGCSIGVAAGMARAGESRPVLATIGDSTFLHAGLPALIDAVYNDADITVLLLDNHITAMTGGQDHPGTGRTLRGEPAPRVDYEALVRAAGVKWVRTVDSYDLAVVHQTLREAIAHRGVSVVISDRPCVIDPVRIKGPALQVSGAAVQRLPVVHEPGLPGADVVVLDLRGSAQGDDRSLAVHRLFAVRAGVHGRLHQGAGDAAAMNPAAPSASVALQRG